MEGPLSTPDNLVGGSAAATRQNLSITSVRHASVRHHLHVRGRRPVRHTSGKNVANNSITCAGASTWSQWPTGSECTRT